MENAAHLGLPIPKKLKAVLAQAWIFGYSTKKIVEHVPLAHSAINRRCHRTASFLLLVLTEILGRLFTVILTANGISHEYRASRSRKAAYFLMRLCASCYAVRQIYLARSIIMQRCTSNNQQQEFPADCPLPYLKQVLPCGKLLMCGKASKSDQYAGR